MHFLTKFVWLHPWNERVRRGGGGGGGSSPLASNNDKTYVKVTHNWVFTLSNAVAINSQVNKGINWFKAESNWLKSWPRCTISVAASRSSVLLQLEGQSRTETDLESTTPVGAGVHWLGLSTHELSGHWNTVSFNIKSNTLGKVASAQVKLLQSATPWLHKSFVSLQAIPTAWFFASIICCCKPFKEVSLLRNC